jgi:hypothetical protein
MGSVENIAAELLEAAADLFESGEREWCQGKLLMPTNARFENATAVCSIGALRTVSQRRVQMVEGYLLGGYLGEQPLAAADIYHAEQLAYCSMNQHTGRASLAHWNDHAVKDVGEVVEAFKLTAKDLRNRASTT